MILSARLCMLLAMSAAWLCLFPAWGRGASLEEIQEAVRRHSELFRNIEYVYSIESRISPGIEKLTPPGTIRADRAVARVHVVRQGNWFYCSVHREKWIGTDKKEDGRILFGYDGVQSRMRSNNHLTISDQKRPLDVYTLDIEKLGFGIAERELIDYLLPINTGGAPNLKINVTRQGMARVGATLCEVIERRATLPQGQGEMLMRIFLAPEFNYLPVKTEILYYHPKYGWYTDTVARADEWREVAPGIWLPFQGQYEDYVHPGVYGNANDFLQSTITYRVIRVSLTPQYPRTFFSNIPAPRDGIITTIRGNQLVSRRVVGNPRDPEEDKTGLPPWVWLLGNVVLVALLLGVYLRYRTGKTDQTGDGTGSSEKESR